MSNGKRSTEVSHGLSWFPKDIASRLEAGYKTERHSLGEHISAVAQRYSIFARGIVFYIQVHPLPPKSFIRRKCCLDLKRLMILVSLALPNTFSSIVYRTEVRLQVVDIIVSCSDMETTHRSLCRTHFRRLEVIVCRAEVVSCYISEESSLQVRLFVVVSSFCRKMRNIFFRVLYNCR